MDLKETSQIKRRTHVYEQKTQTKKRAKRTPRKRQRAREMKTCANGSDDDKSVPGHFEPQLLRKACQFTDGDKASLHRECSQIKLQLEDSSCVRKLESARAKWEDISKERAIQELHASDVR
uniref:Uncharacterized protein n=1 Tax=Steinernema glaseri TaxID=37863 RepID=A0A1I8AS19_9BILA